MEKSLFLGRIEEPIQLQSCLGKSTLHTPLAQLQCKTEAQLFHDVPWALQHLWANSLNCKSNVEASVVAGKDPMNTLYWGC